MSHLTLRVYSHVPSKTPSPLTQYWTFTITLQSDFTCKHNLFLFSLEINHCDSSPCQNNGTCSQEINSYSCECDDGWMGTNCEGMWKRTTCHDFLCTQVHGWNSLAGMLAAKRSAGVAPEVNLRNPLHAGNEAGKQGNPPRLWNPGQTSPQLQKKGISGPTKRNLDPPIFFKKNQFIDLILHFVFISLRVSSIVYITFLRLKLKGKSLCFILMRRCGHNDILSPSNEPTCVVNMTTFWLLIYWQLLTETTAQTRRVRTTLPVSTWSETTTVSVRKSSSGGTAQVRAHLHQAKATSLLDRFAETPI